MPAGHAPDIIVNGKLVRLEPPPPLPVPAPGAGGLKTLTLAVPTVVMSEAGTVAWTELELPPLTGARVV
jgi:hypothetical protein